jgi:transposase InsO family protein
MTKVRNVSFLDIVRILRHRDSIIPSPRSMLSSKMFISRDGIKRQFTTRYTPQHNGVVERKNRTIMYMAQSMLKAKNLPNEYWGDAVVC